VARLGGVPDAGQHIRNGISHAHRISSWFSLPTGLGDTRDITVEGELPETDTAQAELPDESAGPATTAAPVVSPNLEFGLSSSLGNQ
jgi:hypothetical protein